MGTWAANVAKTSVNTSVVAADGRTMTITAKGTNAQGQPMLNVQLYEKK